MNYQTAVPAYGRDYKSKVAVMADWAAGKDFRCEPQGCYINKQDADQARLTVNIRYNNLRSVLVVKAAQ